MSGIKARGKGDLIRGRAIPPSPNTKMSLNNPISKKLSYSLSVWAAVIAIIIGYFGGIRLSVIFVRSAVGFTIFFTLGYVSGLIIDTVLKEDSEEEKNRILANSATEDVNDDTGKAMESI